MTDYTKSATVALQRLYQEIGEALGNETLPQPHHVANWLNDYAEEIGAMNAQYAVDQAETTEGKAKELLRLLTVKVDDTWSGRTNDVRRAQHDGMVRRASELQWEIQR